MSEAIQSPVSEAQELYTANGRNSAKLKAYERGNAQRPSLAPPKQFHGQTGLVNKDACDTEASDVGVPLISGTDDSDGYSSAAPDEENFSRRQNSDQIDAEDFCQYYQDSKALESILEKLTNSVQTLGSALGLWRASGDVRQRLITAREIFVENAATLYPGLKLEDGKKRRSSRKVFQQKAERSNKYQESLSTEPYYLRLSDALKSLSIAIEKFSDALDDFPDFTDHVGRKSLSAFVEEIKPWSSTLAKYAMNGDSPELKRFVLHLGPEMGEHMEPISAALTIFMDIGIPCITVSQKRSARILLNAATVATFFSGVTATTLQYSIGDTSLVAVNTCWFSSLVLSIASAVNSLLAMTWRQAVYSTPKRKVPWWVQIWIRQSYLVLLVASVMTFLGGLLCYVIETQKIVAIWVVVASSIVSIFGLAAVTFWFGWERWDFSRERRRKWLRNAQQDIQDQRWFHWLRYHIERLWRRQGRTLPSTVADLEGTPEKETQPQYQAPTLPVRKLSLPIKLAKDSKSLWRSALTKTKQKNTLSSRAGWGNVHLDYNLVASAVYKTGLETMAVSQVFDQGHGRIRHLQFSPSGQWLVTCGRHACTIYRNGRTLAAHQILKHTASHVKQAEWSPDGQALLTRVSRGFRVWKIGEDNKFRVRSKFRFSAHSMQWLNDAELLVLTDDCLAKLDLSGKTLKKFSSPEDLSLEEMHAVKGSNRILLIANQSLSGGLSSKARPIKCILMIDLSTHNILQNFPLLREVQNISVSKDGLYVLISFADQPPEIWRVSEEVDRITLLHECVTPKGASREKSWGSASFVGPSDKYVACPADGGEIHLWRCDTGAHVRKLSPSDGGTTTSEVSVVAWIPTRVMPTVASAAGDEGTLTLYRAIHDTPNEDDADGGASEQRPPGQASGSQMSPLPDSEGAFRSSENGSESVERAPELPRNALTSHGLPVLRLPPNAVAGASKPVPSPDAAGTSQIGPGLFGVSPSSRAASRHERGPTDEQKLLPEIVEPALARPSLFRKLSRAAAGKASERGQ